MAENLRTFDRLFLSGDDSTYSALEFLDGSGLGLTETFLDTNGLRGSLDHAADRVRRTQIQAGGRLVFAPSPAELGLLLPWIIGGSFASNVITPDTSIPARWLKADRNGTVLKYDGVKVARAEFSASEGSALQAALDVVGVGENNTTLSSPPAVDGGSPFVLADAALTVGGVSYAFRQVSVVVEHPLDVKFNNSLTPSSITAVDRTVSVSLSLPYGDAGALYGSALSGVAVALTFTNGGTSLAISLPAVQAPRQPLPFGGRGVRDLAWAGVARKSGSNPVIQFTLDQTP